MVNQIIPEYFQFDYNLNLKIIKNKTINFYTAKGRSISLPLRDIQIQTEQLFGKILNALQPRKGHINYEQENLEVMYYEDRIEITYDINAIILKLDHLTKILLQYYSNISQERFPIKK